MRFEEDDIIGRGGSATIYKATWLGMKVAKRMFYGSALANEFMKEASTLAKLTVHPDLVTLFDFGENSRSYAIMELMDFDLQTLLQLQGPSPLSVAVDIMHQIARGVGHLHKHNIVHRDLKSSKVLVKLRDLCDFGHFKVKIIDFGLSKTKELCRTSCMVDRGSTRWRAPEISRYNLKRQMCISDAEPSKVPFFKADVYSFAMLCSEILTGKIPFSAMSDQLVEEKVMNAGRPQLPECPDSLRLLIEDCWAVDPLKRPSFSEIVRTLENLRYSELTDSVASTFQVQQQDNKSGPGPDAAISSLACPSRVGCLRCQQLHPHNDGASAIGLIEGTTPIPLPDEVVFSLLGSHVGAVSTRRLLSEAGISVIDLSKSTTPIITQERSCCKGTLVWQKLGEGTSVNGLSESSTPTQDDADSDIGTSLGGASTIQEFGLGTSVIDPTERTTPTLVSEVAGSSPCNASAKAITNNLRQQQLGRGCSATVYKVWKDGRWVAKKVFYGLDHPDFEKEVAVLKSLSHPNIMSLLGYGKEDSCYISMELMDGDLLQLMQELLEHNCDSSPFNIEEAVRIMLQLSEAMKYLHENRVIHGDLKSPNILVKLLENAGVIARVADFGLAMTNKKSRTYSDQQLNVGSDKWMAPELIKFHSDAGDQVDMPQDCTHLLKYPYKADVYAFAVICCEILTGERPFPKISSNKEVKLKVLNGGRPDLPDHCPKRLKYLIERCLNNDPSQRPTFAYTCEQLPQVLDPIDETGVVEEFQIVQVASSYTRKVMATSHTRYTSLSVACTVPCSTKGRGGYFTQVRLLIVGVVIGIFITLVGMGIVSYHQSKGHRVYFS